MHSIVSRICYFCCFLLVICCLTACGSSIDRPIQQAPTIKPNPVSLGGIALGAKQEDVKQRFGSPRDTYSLPDSSEPIVMWDYDGLAVGFDKDGRSVYVELSSAQNHSGMGSLKVGIKGSQAASLLGIKLNSDSNVLTTQVDGGFLKLDLDPENQNVLSIKLIKA